MYSRIADNLYLGEFIDAIPFAQHYPHGLVVNVAGEANLKGYPVSAIVLPIAVSGIRGRTIVFEQQLHDIGTLIHRHRVKGPVLVHCWAGVERSPLTIVYYLHKFEGIPWWDAYDLVMERRPIVQDRTHWMVWKSGRKGSFGVKTSCE
ncbi:dual specificity protein phosphatase family protein [Candidatus Gottesmanbacteria bacterium]|nr:dual specificity protein phosphatase family protein [Candidatus Gottesmanbacteria bacterium]